MQARFALSSCEEWGAEDGQFILQDFYHAIIELFEDEEDEWVEQTLGWWNKYVLVSPLDCFDSTFPRRQIFPDKTSTKSKGKANEDTEPDQKSSRSKAKLARLERANKRRELGGTRATAEVE